MLRRRAGRAERFGRAADGERLERQPAHDRPLAVVLVALEEQVGLGVEVDALEERPAGVDLDHLGGPPGHRPARAPDAVERYLAAPSGRALGASDGSHISSQPPPPWASSRPCSGRAITRLAPRTISDPPAASTRRCSERVSSPSRQRTSSTPSKTVCSAAWWACSMGAGPPPAWAGVARPATRATTATVRVAWVNRKSSTEGNRHTDRRQLAEEVGANRRAGGVGLDQLRHQRV